MKKNSPIIKKNNKKPQPSEKVKKPLTDKPEEVKPKNKPEQNRALSLSPEPRKEAYRVSQPRVAMSLSPEATISQKSCI